MGPVSPAVQFQADSLPQLHQVVRTAALSGTYWLFVGSHEDYMRAGGLIPSWTGVQKLGSSGQTQTTFQQLVPTGAELGEVDAGILTIGDTITAGAFVSRQNSLEDAKRALPAGTGGGLIVEMPQGVFSVYLTSAVSAANLDETSLDAADSAHALLGRRTFHHAWLILGNSYGVRRSWFQVY